MRWDILDAVREAAAAVGIAKIDDFNTGDNEGSSYFQVNQKRGRRWSAARGFLKPVLERPNLRLETGVAGRARRSSRAGAPIGVAFTQRRRAVHGARRVGRGRSSRPARSPRRNSSNSPASATARASPRSGVRVAPPLPGVGENLQDHLQLRPIYKVEGVRTLNLDYAKLLRRAAMALDYALFRRGPLTMAPSQLGAFAQSSPDYATANLEFHFQPLSLDKWGEGLHPFGAFTASVCNLRPSSRGSDPRWRRRSAHSRPRSGRTISRPRRTGASPSTLCA